MNSFDRADFMSAFDGSRITVDAGRVSLIDAGEALAVKSGPENGHVSINPDGTLALVLSDPDARGETSFTVTVDGPDGPEDVTVPIRIVAGEQKDGWGEGDHYMLATDADDRVVVETGENHRKIYVSGSEDALTYADIAALEGVSVDKITPEWLRDHPEYGGSEEMALDAGVGKDLWVTITGRDSEPGSHWLLFERGYTYAYDDIGRVINRGTTGESALHPLHVTSWGEGDQPILNSRVKFIQEESSNIVFSDVVLGAGARMIGGENFLFDNVTLTRHETALLDVERFTLHQSQVIDTYQEGNNTASGFYVGGSSGLLFNETLFDLNGWTLDWQDGSGQEPSKFSHNLYVQFSNTDVSIIDNVFMRAASTGAQIRSGGFIDGNVWIDNNIAFNVKGGEYRNDDWIGNYSLVLDNVVTQGSTKGASNIGAQGWGVQNLGKDSSFVDTIIANLVDLADPDDVAKKTESTGTPLDHLQAPFYDDTIIYRWMIPALRDDRLYQSDQNVPDISEDKLDAATLRSFLAEDLGISNPDSAVASLSTWLRANWGKADAAELITTYFQEEFGIELLTSDGTARFVPDVRGEGFRWDNRLNWTTAEVPQDGDDVDLGGNWVTYAGTMEIGTLDLGPHGVLTVRQGRLDVADLQTGAGGAIKVGLAGQIWVDGYDGAEALSLEIDGGRFANIGSVSGPVEASISGGETLLATAGASFALDGTMEIAGSTALVGFDGPGGGSARFELETGAELAFIADAGGVSGIREFRSGHWGMAAPDIASEVDLGAGNTTLSLALGALDMESGERVHTLIKADEISGGFGSVDLSGTISANVALRLDYETDELVFVTRAGAWSGGDLRFEATGSAAGDVFFAAQGTDLFVSEFGEEDILNLSPVLAPGKLAGLALKKVGDAWIDIMDGGNQIARLSLRDGQDSVLVRLDGQQGKIGYDGLIGAIEAAPVDEPAPEAPAQEEPTPEQPAPEEPTPEPEENADPVAGAYRLEGIATGTLEGQLKASDVDGDSLRYILVSGPEEGSVTLSEDGSFTFDPEGAFDKLLEGERETLRFVYAVEDGRGGRVEATGVLVLDGQAQSAEPAPEAPSEDLFDEVYARPGTLEIENRNDVVNFKPGSELALSEATISFSFTADETAGRNGLFSRDARGAGDHLSVLVENGRLRAQFDDGDRKLQLFHHGEEIEAGTKYHVALSFDGATAKLYVDGAKVAEGSTGMDWTNSSEFVQVGALGWTSTSGLRAISDVFDGRIEDVAIHAGALDASAVAELADAPAPEADAGDGDRTSEANAIYTMPEPLEIDGLSDVMVLEDSDTFDIAQGTIALSFNADSLGGRQGLVSRDANELSGDGNHLSVFIDKGVLKARFQDGEASLLLDKPGIEIDRDYEIALAFGDGRADLYVDGKLADSGETDMIWESSPEPLQIGGLGWSAESGEKRFAWAFDGTIDAFEIYDSALDASAISSLPTFDDIA